MNNLTNDDMRVIVEEIDPDWEDHFHYIEHAWAFYKGYNRDEENQLGHWSQQLDDDEQAIEDFVRMF